MRQLQYDSIFKIKKNSIEFILFRLFYTEHTYNIIYYMISIPQLSQAFKIFSISSLNSQ